MMLDGKVVVITGGGRGIGRACAHHCAGEGAAVVVNDPGVDPDGTGADSRPARETAEAIKQAGGRAYANYANITDRAGALSVIEDALSQFGRIDAVVNAAGILRDAWWHKMSWEDWCAVIDVHLNGAFNICRAATPHFRNQGSGSFILFTSGAALSGNRGQANYAAAKMGVVGLSQSIALDMARFGVRSNCIAPIAYTRLIENLVQDKQDDDPLLSELKTMSPDKVAPLATFLASDWSLDINGQIFGIQRDEIVLYSRPKPIHAMTKEGGWTPDAIAAELLPAIRDDLESFDHIEDDEEF